MQSVGLLQRLFDEHGLATVSLTLSREITELSQPSLACFVEHPFGLTVGEPGDRVYAARHRRGDSRPGDATARRRHDR